MSPPAPTPARATLLPPAPDEDREAVRFGPRALTHRELRGAAAAVAARLRDAPEGARALVWAQPAPETCVAVAGALLAGLPAVPVNPRAGRRELAHVVADSAPWCVLAAAGAALPDALAGVPLVGVDAHARADPEADAAEPAAPALVVYTSGTTGPPKGVVLSRAAIAANLDALAAAWAWTAHDVLVHALPLFHVHGLVLGLLGPLRLGGTVHHLGRFSSRAVASALAGAGTMLFGVPTMYHRLAVDAGGDAALAAALGGARLLVSGSAALPAADRSRLRRACGRDVIERYGMTETLMITAARPGESGVGRPLSGVEVRLVDDVAGRPVADGEVGEVHVRGPSLFDGYLGRPDATIAAFDGPWFRTGDMAVRDPGGALRIVGRRATDLIKSGGFKLGAGEIEEALLEHPGVREAAVTGEPDPELGERVVAWVVPEDPDRPPGERELAEHVALLLSPHKRPRVVRIVDALPRTPLGKVQKQLLRP